MKRSIVTIILCFVTIFLTAQDQTISGVITIDGQTVIGATIYNRSNEQGTTSDLQGQFKIEAVQGQTIEVKYLGFTSYIFDVDQKTNYQIELAAKSFSLNEVVVTALGLKRKSKALGYSIQELKARDISQVKSANFLDNLSGKLAGVSISHGATGVGSTSKIVIRGESSFRNNNPLFVVDGIPVTNQSFLNVTNEQAAGFQEIDFGNGAMDINPDDIASLSVLKGPGAAALYGTRASNGVIVIETKDGSSAKGLGVSFNSSFYIDRAFVLPQFQNTYGQGNSGEFTFVDGLGGGINDNITYSYGPELDIGLNIPQFDSPVTLPDGSLVRGGDVSIHGGLPITPSPFVSNPDNLKNFYETGKTWINNISIANSSDNGSYRLSFTDLRSDSHIPGVNLNRQTVAGKFSFTPNEKLKVTSSINYMYTQSDNRPASGYGSENINYSLVAWMGRQTNIESLKDYWQPGLDGLQQYSFNYTFFDNPYFILLENRNAFDRNRIFGNVAASYDLSHDISIMIRSGLDNLDEDRTFRRAYSSNRFRTGAYAENNINFREINTDFLINYNKSFSTIDFDFSIGANRLEQQGGTLQSQAIGLAQAGIYSLANAASPLEVFQNNFRKRINSVYGIAKFAWKDQLFIDVTGRNDWSSALANPDGTNEVAFFYPSISASYILSEALPLPSLFSFAKLRASWAQVGNDTDPYQTEGVFLPQTPVNGNPTFSEQSFIANNNLLPERSTAFEVGADLRFIDDRVSLDLSYYISKNENQILSLPIALSTGFEQQVTNGGTIRSKGLEALVGLDLVRNKNLRWRTFFNFSTNRSIVEDLPDGSPALTLAYSRVYDNTNQTVWFIVEEGGAIGDIWGTGYQKNEDGEFVIGEDGKLIVDNSLKKLGNYNPDFILGFSNDLSFRNVSLRFNFDWRQGGSLVSRTQALAGVGGQLAETENRPAEGLIFPGVINVGTQENPSYQPNNIAINPETYYRQFYDRNHEENNLYDASYLKLRELQLSYSIPDKWLAQGNWHKLENVSLSLIGRNLFALSKIPHFDPEQLAVQGNGFISGVEDMSYPSARSIGLSLNLNF